MRRPGLRLVLLLAGLAVGAAARAEERILDFRADVQLAADGGFTVEERIVYSFGDASRHGIYREIPVRYGRGAAPDYRIALEVESVRDGRGQARPFAVESRGAYRRIRIGSASRTVTGEQEYRIRYRVERGILWLADHDELYWNATGTEWRIPIDRSEVTVTAPEGRGPGELRVTCFTGARGSVEQACTHAVSGRTAHVGSERGLGPKEGLSIAVALPKGLLDEPSGPEKALRRAGDYASGATALPFLLFFGMGALWWRYGRDPSGPVAIPVRYEPPEGMTPAEMGTVLDEKADLKDVTASILDLAVRGYLRIEEKESKRFLFFSETDYVLHRTGGDASALKSHERKLLAALFGDRSSVDLSSLKNEFYTELPGIQKALYAEVSQEGRWFPAAPDAVRRRYATIGLVLTLPLAALAFLRQSLPAALSLLACAGVIVFWSRYMPRRTRRGRRARQHIRGFQEFVQRVEADRLERLGMRSLEQFEKLLPYAFVLGAADEWAAAFADLYREPPSWFLSSSGDRFRPRLLVDRVGRALDTAGTVMASKPRGSGSSGFGGGGFSGGGFGGGGGGSW